jgi:TolB-like protein/DNA-binding winged helix-turn-helix (wHTH) protein/tetratricopeptide (TPR) repeat protein
VHRARVGSVVDGDFRLASWLVRPSLNSVFRNDTSIQLEPKVMAVLVCLASHAPEPVPKEKLLQEVWPDTFVGEGVLVRSIFELRRVFEDEAKEPHVIQTIAKRGYRLVVPVVPVNGTSGRSSVASLDAEPVRDGVRWGRVWRIGALAIVGAILLCGLLLALNAGGLRDRMLGRSQAPVIHSLAVLPLTNLSNDPNQGYFADGMTDALITDLAQISSLKVISRTSTMRYQKSDKSLPEIARELNVDGLVEGTVQRSGDRVRITAQLIHGPSDKHLWASSYERDVGDVFALERDITEEIARQVQAHLTTPHNQPAPAQPRPVNVKALEAYLRGKYHLDRIGQGFGDEESKKAGEYFQQAISADPNFVQAYLGLANAHRFLFKPSDQDDSIVDRAVQRALELDPSSSEARVILGDLKAERWDWSGAEEEYRRSVALNPNNAEAHSLFADYLDKVGRLEEGWKEVQIAHELNPHPDTLPWALDLPQALYYRGEYDRAIELLLRVTESHPNDGQTRLRLSQCYEVKGMYKEAIEELERTATLYGFPQTAARLHRAFAASGYRGALRQYAQEIERLQATKQMYMPAYLATVYARLGDNDHAFYWMGESYNLRAAHGRGSDLYNWLKTDPMLKSLRSDPRYFDLLRRVGLPP